MNEITYYGYIYFMNDDYEDCFNKSIDTKDFMERELFIDDQIDKYESDFPLYRIDRFAEMECPFCGETVGLSGWTNVCSGCDQYYNSNGETLAPPEYWGEETGENVFDIFNGRDEDY